MNKLALFCITCVATVRCGLRVIGGRDAAEDEFPYVVRLERHIALIMAPQQIITLQRHTCTGSVLTPTITLTAAHCLTEKAPDYVIRYGSLTRNSVSKVISHISHPTFLFAYPTRTFSDIALLQTETIHMKQYGKVSAIDPATLTGQQIILAGHGITNSSAFRGATFILKKPLQLLDVIVIGCSGNPAQAVNSLKPRMCVARRCGQSAAICPGDSGGPALHSSGIVALNTLAYHSDCQASVKKDRDRSHMVGMLTPVSSFVGWISSYVQETSPSRM